MLQKAPVSESLFCSLRDSRGGTWGIAAVIPKSCPCDYALLVTAEHPSGQPEHPVVVTSEDLFERLLFNHLVACLLLYIQSGTPFS